MKLKIATDITVEEVQRAELDELVIYERLLIDHTAKQRKGWKSWFNDPDRDLRFLLLLVQTRLEDLQRTREVREHFFAEAKRSLPSHIFMNIYTAANNKIITKLKILK